MAKAAQREANFLDYGRL